MGSEVRENLPSHSLPFHQHGAGKEASSEDRSRTPWLGPLSLQVHVYHEG